MPYAYSFDIDWSNETSGNVVIHARDSGEAWMLLAQRLNGHIPTMDCAKIVCVKLIK